MLDEEAVVALLGILDEQAPDIPALPVLRAIVHYGVEPDAMAEVGERILERLDVGADNRLRPEYLRAMRELLVPRAEQRLREIAAALDDPESFTAASLLGASPSAADDPIAPHVPVLASRAERGDDLKAVRELAWLPLEQYGVQADVFVKALSSKDIDSRVWASIAIAKLGDPAPLLQVLRDLPAGPPAWMWGNPWTAYNMVSRARPVPEQVRATLLSLHEDDLDRDQRIIAWALTGTKTAEGQEIETEPPEPPAHPVPAEELDTDAFLASVRAATSQGDYERLPLDDLPRADSLSPDQHAEVVSRLVWASMREDRRSVADGWGNATMDALGRARTLPLDVDGLLATYIDALGTRMNQRQLGAVLSRADDDGVVHSVVQALRDAPNARTANDLAYLLDYASVGDVVYVGAGPPPLLQAIPPLSILPPEFQAPAPAPTAPAPAPSGQMPPPAPTPEPAPPRSAPGIGWPWKWLRRRRLRVEVGGDSLQLDPGPSGPPVLVRYAAHPCIALDDDVVVIGEEFTVTLGLAAMPTPGVASPGAIAVEVEVESFPIDDLEVELVVDPESVEVLGGQRVFPLNVRGMDDFPVHAVRLRALFTPGLDQDRRIAVLYRRGGRVVGFAFRMVRAVENDAARRRSDPPAPIKESVLDLAPLVDDGPPDLLLCLFHGDAPDSYVWGIYPRSGTAVPDLRRGGRLPDARDFATYTQRAVRSRDFKGGKAYDQLVGYGIQIDDVMPTLVTEAIRDAVAAAPDRAPSVLLLTQEPFVPWELAVPTPRLTSTYGGDSPFVGAHAAISRWPLSENQKPVLTRLPTVTVSRQAAITADYTGVKAWPPLEHARAEVRELVGLYGMTEVGASREELRACLTGDTAFDVIHVALHGQRDPQGLEDGLVLLEPDASGNPGPTFFNATQVLGLENHASQPFVFLNACQVGSGEAVLGTYAGFAINLLRTRASAVVAPLWNVDDNVAAAITRDFYDSAYAEEPAPVAEILRRVRASYTEAGVQADPESCTPTLVAYQCFGHPHFTLRRHPAGEMEEQP